jgi:hypothetical protein
MSFSLHFMAAGTFTTMLGSLSKLLDKGAEHAAARGWKPEALPAARLTPDMLPLSAQIQIACDTAKNGIARLAAVTPPKFADDEKTIDELKDRIQRTIAYVESVPETAFAGAEERRVLLPLPGDIVVDLDGARHLRDWCLPNFYFHLVTAYDILRESGVAIGKQDYMTHVGPAIRPREAA